MDKEKNGFRIIKNWQFWLAILSWVAGIIFNAGITYSKIDNVEQRVAKLESKENQMTEMKECINEIKINLKVLLEKNGLKYQTK
jgi:hypothetical protein